MNRLRFSLLLVVITALIGAGWAVDYLFESMSAHPESATDEHIAARLLGHELAVRMHKDPLVAETLINSAALGADRHITLTRQSRSVLPVPPELLPALESPMGLALESDTGVAFWFATSGSDSIITLDIPVAAPASGRLRLALTLLFYACVIVLLLIWLRPLISRLQALEKSARAFGSGLLDTRVTTRQDSPIAELESSFNAMASRIEGLVEDNRLLGSAVSHDLKTPLARLRFGIDAVLELEDSMVVNDASDESTKMRRRFLGRMADNITAMESLVAVLLDYTRLDRRLHDMPIGSVDLADIISCVVELASGELVEPQGPTIIWSRFTQGVSVIAEERYAYILVENLISNAQRHARATVQVSLEPGKASVTLRVEDDGPGIDAADRVRVLQPFVRLANDTERSNVTGHGLGLAIVARIAAWHHATLLIDASPALGGARVSVVFRSV